MTNEERIAVAKVEMRLAGVHPAWVEHMSHSWSVYALDDQAAIFDAMLDQIRKYGVGSFGRTMYDTTHNMEVRGE